MMDVLLWILILVVIAAGIAVAVAVLRRRRPSRPAPHPDPLRRDEAPVAGELRDLGPGAIVTYQGRDWTVRGSLDFDAGGFAWSEHLLDDLEVRRWLSVEDAEVLEVVLWQALPLADLDAGQAGDREVTAGGTAYRLQERGEATFRARGTTGTAASGQYAYADYAAAEGGRLSFERFGGDASGAWELGVGQAVTPAELTVYPAGRS